MLDPLIPVLVLKTEEEVRVLGEFFQEAGLQTVEIALRTPESLKLLSSWRQKWPLMRVGAGTVRTKGQIREAVDSGAQFFMSPGFLPETGEAALQSGYPYYPGVDSPYSIEAAQAQGWKVLKFFPAELSGGPRYLKAMEGPYQEVRFIPTGGVDLENFTSYLACTNVVGVGLTSLAPRTLLDQRDWKTLHEGIRQFADRFQNFKKLRRTP